MRIAGFQLILRQSNSYPRGVLHNLITEDAVAHELNTKIATQQELIKFICQSAEKVFASAILATYTGKDLRKSMSRFKTLGFSDASLPVTRADFDRIVDGDRVLRKLWTNIKKGYFVDKQWIFLAPIFPDPENLTEEKLKLVFLQEHIFPFTFVHETRREGSFGFVYQVTIHPSHQESIMKKVSCTYLHVIPFIYIMKTNTYCYFKANILQADGTPANAAMKELKASISEDQMEVQIYKEWNTEATALAKLSRLRHEHMIQVRAIITRGGKHYFMFQWADGGCLQDFYIRHRRPSLDSNFVKDIVLQLRGLADALNALHNFKEGGQESYRHGDLKPENILIFEDGKVGVWKIADMGLAKHHLAPTVLRGEQTTTLYGTRSYEPPEVTQIGNNPAGARSRLYDIWSMGCITLELVMWLLYGYDWLLEFNKSLKVGSMNASPYWEPEGNGGAKVHRSVIFSMGYIAENDPECTRNTSSAIKDLLQLVKTKLLVVALPMDSRTFVSPVVETPISVVPTLGPTINFPEENNQLRPDPTPGPYRAKAQVFSSELDKILEKGSKDDKYWFSGTLRGGIATPPIPGSRLLATPAPLNRTRDRRLQDEYEGLRAPPVRPDVSHYLSFKVIDLPCINPSLLTSVH